MGKYGEILEDFYEERTRILHALALEENKHIIMRLIGALAFRTHCQNYGYIQDQLGRKLRAALASMLQSCSVLAVVNIDAGFTAGAMAARIANMVIEQ